MRLYTAETLKPKEAEEKKLLYMWYNSRTKTTLKWGVTTTLRWAIIIEGHNLGWWCTTTYHPTIENEIPFGSTVEVRFDSCRTFGMRLYTLFVDISLSGRQLDVQLWYLYEATLLCRRSLFSLHLRQWVFGHSWQMFYRRKDHLTGGAPKWPSNLEKKTYICFKLFENSNAFCSD